jgi:hypothetical protein
MKQVMILLVLQLWNRFVCDPFFMRKFVTLLFSLHIPRNEIFVHFRTMVLDRKRFHRENVFSRHWHTVQDRRGTLDLSLYRILYERIC